MAISENTTSSDDVGLGAGDGGAHSLEVGVERAHRQVELGGRQAHGAMISDTKMLTWAALLALVLATQDFARSGGRRAAGGDGGPSARRREVR